MSTTGEEKTIGADKPAIFPTGLGIGGVEGGGGIILTFYWVPPEEKDTRYVQARIALDLEHANLLSKGIAEAIEKVKSSKKS